MSKISRGIRNNNPLNIKVSSSNWVGKVTPNTDGTFEQFDSLVHGYRAAFYLFRKYINVYKLVNLKDFIAHWCPDDTSYLYYKFVCDRLLSSPNDILDFSNRYMMFELALLMTRFENGIKVSDECNYLDFPYRYEIFAAYDLLTSK